MTITPNDLEQIERAFEKAKRSPQAMADWANEHGAKLFAAAREGFPEFVQMAGGLNDPNPPVDLAALYATTDAAIWGGEFCRVAREVNGLQLDEGWVAGWFANAMETQRTHTARDGENVAIEPYLMALRPFASLGAPSVIKFLHDKAEELGGVLETAEPFAFVVDDDQSNLASASLDDFIKAHELVAEADGGK